MLEMNMKTKILEINNLSKKFFIHNPGLEIESCKNVSFSLEEGGFLGIVGRSGAGKSTILKCINRSYISKDGEILYFSEAFGKINLATASERKMLFLRRHEIGYVSQFLNIMPRTTAKEHVMNALTDTGEDSETAAKEMLTYFRLPESLWNIYPSTLSGGERLRLNLAHAMVKKPRLLMLDEPTASLDSSTKILVRDMLQKLKATGTSMVGIFHDIAFMKDVCDDVYEV
jgi:alpha-D-ribose 1-methylphosphonate 5-triphosphate synthase subunit PhnL